MSPQLFDEFLSPMIDSSISDVLKDTIPSIRNIQDLPNQINRLGQMFEGQEGIYGLIAKARNYVLKGKSPKEQIDELSKEGIIPNIIKNKLDSIRTKHNIIKHEESSRNKLKISDVEEIRDMVIYVLDWFYCECPFGPKLESIFMPHKVISVNVGHLRTLISLANVTTNGVKSLCNTKTLSNQEFVASMGFEALCSLIDQYSLGNHIDGLSVGIGAEVEVDGVIRGAFLSSGWPARLLKNLKDRFPKMKISLLNDAVGYAYGVKKENLEKPILALTLGDGVGCAIILKETVEAKELGSFPIPSNKHIHQYLGTAFFLNEARAMQWDFIKIRNEYSSRMLNALKLLKNKYDFNSVVLGGGRSVFCDEVILNTELKKNNIVANVQSDDDVILNGLANYWRLEQIERKI